MHDPAVAEILRDRGFDVRAVAELEELRGLGDEELLACATLDHRALVTENVKDFAPLHAVMIAADVRHDGLIFTHPKRFPTAKRDAASHLASALAHFLGKPPPGLSQPSFLWWLDTTAG